jgi:hypothetical protein
MIGLSVTPLSAAALTKRRAVNHTTHRGFGVDAMAYEDAKQWLSEAQTVDERREAIRAALGLGMPLYEVEVYLDWLDANRLAGNRMSEQSVDDRARLQNP